MKQAYLECGKIINTHGFRGTVKLESRCDSPEILADLKQIWFLEKGSYVPRRVKHASVFKQFVIAHLEGINDEDAANRLRGKTLYAAREDIPLRKGAYFLADLVGLPVLDAADGREYGRIEEISFVGGQELFVVRTPKDTRLLPNVPAFIDRVDVAVGVYVTPIEGLLED